MRQARLESWVLFRWRCGRRSTRCSARGDVYARQPRAAAPAKAPGARQIDRTCGLTGRVRLKVLPLANLVGPQSSTTRARALSGTGQPPASTGGSRPASACTCLLQQQAAV